MKHLVIALTLAAALPAAAQDLDSFARFAGGGAPAPLPGMGMAGSVGITGGWMKSKGADEGTWFAGIGGRMDFTPMFGAEATITFHQQEFGDGSATITEYPIQVTGLFFPPIGGLSGVKPYALAGMGWYYATIDFDDSIGLDTETSSSAGIHVGIGAELPLGGMTGYIDVRYIFIDEEGVDNSNIEDEDFDLWQIAFGVNFGM